MDDNTTPYQQNPYDDRPEQNDAYTAPLAKEQMWIDKSKLTGLPNAPTAAPRPPRNPQRRNTLIIVIAAVAIIAIVGGGIFVLSGKHGSSSCVTCPIKGAAATLTPIIAATQPPATIAPTVMAQQPTAASLTTCASIAAFAKAGAASTGSTNFLSMAFPPGTVAQPSVDGESNSYQSRTLALCTPGITSAATLQTTFGAALVGKGWQPATPPTGATCGANGCWRQSDTSVNATVAATQYIGLGPVMISGSVATYTAQLLIAPLTVNTLTMTQGTTSSFEQGLEKTPRPELQWDANGKLHTIAGNNVIGMLLPANGYATTTYATISSAISGFGQLTDIPLVAGTSGALKGTAGFYIKFIIQATTVNQITLTYVIYPYGF